jgi:hypothetical protein
MAKRYHNEEYVSMRNKMGRSKERERIKMMRKKKRREGRRRRQGRRK